MSANQPVDYVALLNTGTNLLTPALSFSLTLPWHALVSDNGKYGVYRGKMILTKKYREAKDAIATRAIVARGTATPLDGRLRLRATVYEPDGKRLRDIVNFAKLTHDGLNGILFYDDSQLDDVRWLRGPLDPQNPRVEITVRALRYSVPRT